MSANKRVYTLRLRRATLGLRLKEVAAHVGVGITRINSFENGLIPPAKHRKKYAEILQMSESMLESAINGELKIKVTFE